MFMTPLIFHAIDFSAREVGSGLAVSALIGTVVRLLSGALLDRGIRCSWPIRGTTLLAIAADLILLEGGGQEPWLSAVSLPEEAMVVASPKEPSPSTLAPSTSGPGTAPADDGAHRHGPGGATHRQGQPVLSWLDLQRLGRQCERVHRELAARRPLEAETLAASHRSLQQRLQALDSAFLAAARPLRDIAMVAAGGEVQPLARRYGLSMRFSRHRPGSDPSGGHQLFLQELDDLARQAPLDVVVLPAPPAPDLKAELARRRLRVLVVDPLVDPDGGSAFPQGLQRNLEALRALSERS